MKAAQGRLADAKADMAAEQERSKASGTKSDGLKQRMLDLQAQLDQLQKEKEEAEGKSAKSLKAEALARQKLRAIKGGEHVTSSGCQCAAAYTYNGETHNGCITDDANTLAKGKSFCVVLGDFCGSELEDGQRFDECSIATKRS